MGSGGTEPKLKELLSCSPPAHKRSRVTLLCAAFSVEQRSQADPSRAVPSTTRNCSYCSRNSRGVASTERRLHFFGA